MADGVEMSQKSLAADLSRTARKARGKQGHLTRVARDSSLARFAGFLWQAGFQIHATGQIQEKHIEAWVANMMERSLTPRTIANNMAHIRTALEGIGRRPFADRMSNAVVGIAGASRSGTKRPLAPEEAQRYIARAEMIDEGVAMVLRLQMEFGLRAQEAVRCVPSLPDWSRVLNNAVGDGMVTIIHGTKGGKTRRSPALDRAHAAELVQEAMDLARRSNGRLVRKPDLKKAMERYHYVVRKAGMGGEIAPHSLRYAYACEHLRRLKDSGISRREAAAGVSMWLGHGDGRGRWIETVYGKQALAEGHHA